MILDGGAGYEAPAKGYDTNEMRSGKNWKIKEKVKF